MKASVSNLIPLLTTVTVMVTIAAAVCAGRYAISPGELWQVITSGIGAAGAGELASGIYHALVSTVAGLIIAIPALGGFAVFRNRIDQLVAEAAYLAQHALAPLKRRRLRTPVVGAAPPAPPPIEGGR